MAGQVSRDGALSRTGRPVDGNNDVSLGLQLGGLVRTHPRFFVPCLLRLLKNRLPLAPDRPAAASVGRLLRAPGVLLCGPQTTLRPASPSWRCRCACSTKAPSTCRCGAHRCRLKRAKKLPVERVPLLVARGMSVPFCFPFFEALQRGLDADRVPLCGLDWKPGAHQKLRRAGRPLEADDAGLLELADLRSCPFE